jgi:aminocarboxymuconate-semialdehyde decarboxylase
MQKIDVFTHILPEKYLDALASKTDGRGTEALNARRRLSDLDIRFRIMDLNEGYAQILNIAGPPVEDVANPTVAAELAKIANDEMAELVLKYPEKFLAAVACLPMNNMKAVVKEVDRAIIDLGFRGIQITTNIMDKPVDSPEFEPLFERMNYYQLPILIHPRHMKTGPRAFGTDSTSLAKDRVEWLAQKPFLWPYETTVTMGHFVWSGMLEKYPNLKIVTHHCGGLTPYQANRIWQHQSVGEREMYLEQHADWHFTKRPYDYFKMMYGDTAVWGNTAILMCGYDFFGVDHIVFGTDMPFGGETGGFYVRETINSVEKMAISDDEKRKIFEENPRNLFHLPVEV